MSSQARMTAILIALLTLCASATAQSGEDIGAPNKVPDMSGFRTEPDTIEPGHQGKLNFTLSNRYNGQMENATLVVEIYKWATIDEAEDIGDVHHPPTIEEGQGQYYERVIGVMVPGDGMNVLFHIDTREDTPEGTYFVRTMMEFDYEGETYEMRSRGHFSNKEWEVATDDMNLNQSVGGINITMLGVDGILVDTSFSVKSPMPMWPLALLIGLTVFFAALAVVFYLVEEDKGHNRLKKIFFPRAGKVKQKKMLLEKDLKERRKSKRTGDRKRTRVK